MHPKRENMAQNITQNRLKKKFIYSILIQANITTLKYNNLDMKNGKQRKEVCI